MSTANALTEISADIYSAQARFEAVVLAVLSAFLFSIK